MPAFFPTRAALLAAGCLLLCGGPSIPAASGQPSPPAAQPSPSASPLELDRTQTEARLAEARKGLEGLAADPQADPEKRLLLEQFAATCERTLATIEGLESSWRRLAITKAALDAWKRPAATSIFPMERADQLRRAIAAGQGAVQSAARMQSFLETRVRDAQDEMGDAEARVRRLADIPNPKPEDAAGLEKEKLRVRVLAEELYAADLRRKRVEADKAEQQASVELARKELEAIRDRATLQREDVERIHARIDAEAKKLQAELAQLARRPEPASPPDVEPGLSESETVAVRTEVLRWRLDLLRNEKQLWNLREVGLNAPDAAARGAAHSEIGKLAERIRYLGDGLDLRISSGAAKEAELAAQLEGPRKGDATFERVRAAIAARTAALEAARHEVTRLTQMVSSWGLASVEGGAAAVRGQMDTLWARTLDAVTAIWNTELYRVRDTVLVDGREIAGDRPITVGKIIKAVLILLAGYAVIRWLARRLERWVIRRTAMQEEHARVVRGWALFGGLALLLLYALHEARIPVTAFAFLGGALAIGVGFGTQNLLKNFISGLILTFEKPFRLHDTLQVGDITGEVVKIGLRSSVIRHPDGIETLVPNSALLENNVTNWNYSDEKIRQSVRVGVAYGTDVRLVADLLERLAREHGSVLKQPEPAVFLEDFGESALQFLLLFWVDGRVSNRVEVGSDLRFMIEAGFRKSGIEIPFPQRVVRVVKEPGDEKSGGAA